MILLQATQLLNDDSVNVSSLPHPISMFFLGMFFILTVVLFVLYVGMVKNVKEQRKEIEKLHEKMQTHTEQVAEKMMFISKKIDSRIDKALNRK